MFDKRIALATCVLGAALALGACSTPRVRTDADAKASIANYRTYVWERQGEDYTAGGPAFKNPLNQKRLRAAVDANLAKRGLQPAGEGVTPDSYVTVAIGTRQVIDDDPYSRFRFGVGLGWGRWHHPGYMGSLNWYDDGLYSYSEGRVSVDLYDAKTREPIWHAAVDQDLSYLTGSNAEARINTAVDAMFAKFPGTVSADAK